MDKIKIEDLEVFGHHGVFKEENVLGQKFLVTAILHLDTRKAGLSDDLEDSINYGQICNDIERIMKEKQFKLIESVAEYMCMWLLKKYNKIHFIELEIKKPWAPILIPLKSVSITIKRGWHTVYLSLGSNLGNKEEYLNQGIDKFRSDELSKVTKQSEFMITKPYGYEEQPDFLNACICIKTLRTPYELLDFIHQIEVSAERVREIHWGPRTLDIDILFYDSEVLNEDDLIIPHKEIPKREFVLKPLSEIAPNLRHPIYQKSVREMLEDL